MKLPHFDRDELHVRRVGEDGLQAVARRGTAVAEKMTRTLLARSSSTCKSGHCGKPESSTTTMTLPIVLGAVIPICCAIIVFVFLHRRNKKKQAIEDANDPHKSLDFGVENGATSKKKKGRKGPPPEMTITDMGGNPIRSGNHPRGLSMDMLGSPYLLPAGLHGSRESLHSMSRSVQDEHDPYRPVAFLRSSSETARSPRPFNENGSVYSASTMQTGHTGNEKSNLLVNAQRMSQSFPKRGDSISPSDSSPTEDFPTRDLHSSNRNVPPARKGSANSSTPTLPNISETNVPQNDLRKPSPPPLPPLPQEGHEPAEHMPPPRTSSTSLAPPPPRKSSMHASSQPGIDSRLSNTSTYEDDIPPPPPPPKWIEPEVTYYEDADPGISYYEDAPDHYAGRFSIDTPAPSQQFPVQNNRMSVMGLRPLPPDINPEDNPEQRANRIRSFYKEYFDDSRPNPQNMFYEDWDPDFLDAATYDSETGDYMYPQAPFAQPMGRRAMTPPPRGGPQFPGPVHGRHYSTQSAGRGPRPGPRQPPKKKLPPPKTLTSLPTPHKLRDENFIFDAADFAPPTSFREVQNGRRPDSPLGIQRPFSPAVRAHSPLVAAFDDLAVLPSPHHLRKSGTFTSLDFAPPRFRGQDSPTMSDAGSIRSARSGISNMQMNAVRTGAYRVSRIPKEMVTTRNDLSQQLRPKMDLISRA